MKHITITLSLFFLLQAYAQQPAEVGFFPCWKQYYNEETGFDDYRYGFINANGEVVITHQYDEVRIFSEGLAAVRSGEHWGFIDTTGKLVIAFKYLQTDKFENGSCYVYDGSEGHRIDKGGKRLPDEIGESPVTIPFPCTYNWYNSGRRTSDGVLQQTGLYKTCNGAYILIREETTVVPSSINTGRLYSSNNSGEDVFAYNVDNGLIPVTTVAEDESDQRYGFIDTLGNIIIPPSYVAAFPFSEERAWVALNSEWRVINRSGKWAMEQRYPYDPDMYITREDLEPFFYYYVNGLALVYLGPGEEDESLQTFGYVDTNGNIVWKGEIAW